ncbi:MAG: error-prone DNA polymerase, partial [Candidatus Parcubacteria bacterium]|nr:error-prone DNA polymerase [Burkholderiales bacterium]
ELAQRAGLGRRELKCLAAAGALQSLAGHRRDAHWAASGLEKGTALLPGAAVNGGQAWFEPPTEGEEILADYASLGLTLGRHPLALVRADLEKLRVAKAEQLHLKPHGGLVRAAGLVTCRQRPDTKSGVVFVTLEDETGYVNVVIWSDLFERHRKALLEARLLGVEGVVQREGLVVHLLARRFIDYSPLLSRLVGPLEVRSHDFH